MVGGVPPKFVVEVREPDVLHLLHRGEAHGRAVGEPLVHHLHHHHVRALDGEARLHLCAGVRAAHVHRHPRSAHQSRHHRLRLQEHRLVLHRAARVAQAGEPLRAGLPDVLAPALDLRAALLELTLGAHHRLAEVAGANALVVAVDPVQLGLHLVHPEVGQRRHPRGVLPAHRRAVLGGDGHQRARHLPPLPTPTTSPQIA
mmetsp:Transcript_40284/g.75441  ORF Transcript_40284/g.75441 Transcript_40284/m.75441 type:complete len:201 (+) Transcript_40284:2025-2627(+)